MFAAFAETADVRAGAEGDVVQSSPVSSETRSPVCTARSKRAVASGGVAALLVMGAAESDRVRALLR